MTDSLDRLYEAVQAARHGDPATSRTTRLLQAGRGKMAKKLAEEAVEVVIDAMAGRTDAVIKESADLVYNLVVLWVEAGVRPADVWADLPKLLALAQYENVRVKISGACTMSHQPFPYDDIWEPVLRVIDAFGLDRCMWGTDWTRTIGMLTYEQGVAPFRDTKRLSESDKAALMGGTLQKVYKW